MTNAIVCRDILAILELVCKGLKISGSIKPLNRHNNHVMINTEYNPELDSFNNSLETLFFAKDSEAYTIEGHPGNTYFGTGVDQIREFSQVQKEIIVFGLISSIISTSASRFRNKMIEVDSDVFFELFGDVLHFHIYDGDDGNNVDLFLNNQFVVNLDNEIAL